MSSNEGKEQAAGISNLQESFSKQQKKISALKELVRKSEVAHGKSTSTAQEKVKNIAQRLTLLKSKARSRHSLDAPQPDATTVPVAAIDSEPSQTNLSITSPSASNYSTPNPTPLKPQHRSDSNTSLTGSGQTSSATPGSEKILLLRQQMEQNRALMAQRASSKQHLEQLVTQLKEKFDSTQQCLEDTSELGKSMTNLSALPYTPVTRERYKSATDLSTQSFSLEKERIKFLENRCRLLEKQLEKEKQTNSSRDASLNESLTSQASSKRIKELENKVLELEEVLKEQKHTDVVDNNKWTAEIQRLQSVIAEKEVDIESLQNKLDKFTNEDVEAKGLQVENERLRQEIEEQLRRIGDLEIANDVLETTRCDLTEKSTANYEHLQELQTDLDTSNEKLQHVRQELEETETKCVALQADLDSMKTSSGEPVADNTDSQVKAEMAKQIKELQDKIEVLTAENLTLKQTISEREKLEVSDASIAEKIAALESTIESQREDLQTRTESFHKQEEELMEKTIELNVLNANFKVLEEKLQATNKNKPLFSTSGIDEAGNPELKAENQQLKQKLDESNKAMIKLKLKCKQTEKQMEKLKKSSDLHSEVIKLQKANEELQQKIIELEDEKGQWQLMQVDSDAKAADSTANLADKSVEVEQQLKEQAETIRLLEQEKQEQSDELVAAKQELLALQEQLSGQDISESARVKSEMSEIHFEEKVDEQAQELKSLQERLAAKTTKIEELQHKLDELQVQKQSVDKKLEHYISENIELLDKVEKLSKSSSSAESIEIVERLTQQERAEIDEFNKRLDQEHNTEHAASLVSELTQTEMGSELSESLVKLREESSELMNKIELFTTERREVLEKMEHLTAENHELVRKVEELTEQQDLLETNVLLAENAKSTLESKLQELTKEKDLLASQVAESSAQKAQLSQELTSLQKSSEVVAAIDTADGVTLFDKCEKSLSKLNSELEAYRKANDKNAKFNASKKLAKEAKNAHAQLSELLQKVKEASTAVETVTVVETVVAVTAPNGKALAEYEQLTAQNRVLKATVDELRRELQEERNSTHEPIVEITELPAIKQPENVAGNEEKLQKALQEISDYEEKCIELQSNAEDLRRELREALIAGDERCTEMTELNAELTTLRKLAEDFDRLMNDKEMSFEKQVVQLTRLRKELEAKCETYEGEMEILQTLVTEQKQQLIEAYKESEHEMNLKLLELQHRDEQIVHLRTEVAELKESSNAVGTKMSNDLQEECEKLREKLRINKALVAEQINELANKQETIDTLNQQMIDLYKTMEENANKVIEKEDEIAYLQETLDTNNQQLDGLRKDNNAQKSVVDKLLGELHSHRTSLPQLEGDVQRLEQANKQLQQTHKELEQRNKDQLEKLKKYAANLKKRAAQCHEYEAKIKELEKGALEAMESKELTQNNGEELQQIKAQNVALSKQVKELEAKSKEIDGALQEKQEAVQEKTIELLETMEHSSRLESELQQTQLMLEEKTQEIVQLQNALSASQEQESDWGNDSNTDTLQQLAEKSNIIAKLEQELKHAEEQLGQRTEEVAKLRSELEQTSDWNVENINAEELRQELTNKTSCLEQAERDLSEVQAELQQMHESERERQQSVSELQASLQHKHELVVELEKQLAEQMIGQQDVAQTLQEQQLQQQQRLTELSDELKAKSLKFEKSKAVIKERNNQIQRLQVQLKQLQDKLSAQPEEELLEVIRPTVQAALNAAPPQIQMQVTKDQFDSLQQAYDKLREQYATEKSNFEATIARLETLHDGIQAKLQEDMSYIETLEQENTKFKQKTCKLEECVATFEERRASMERRANLLDEQMQSRANEYGKSEDELIYRLNMLSEHDDIIGRRLLDTQEEKEELLERVDRLQGELKESNAKYTKLEKDHQAYQEDTEASLEAEKLTLREQLTAAELEMQRLRSQYDAKLATKSTEVDELECELSDQLEKINTEKRALSEDLERTRDECTAQKDEIVRLNESLNAVEQAKQELEREASWLRMQNENVQQDQYELQELRMQTLQDKTENDNLRHQIDSLATNHEMELQALRMQISELDTLRMQVGQNQTDDQVFIETENKRLTDLLAEKEAVIENYQRQNLQLQMAAAAATTTHTQSQAAQSQPDAFALAFGLPPAAAQSNVTTATQPLFEERERLEQQLADKSELVARLQRDISALQSDVRGLRESNADVQRQLMEKSRELEQLRAFTGSAGSQLPSDVIPAPPMFFASEQMVPSPFDEIVQVRTVNTLEGAALSRERREQQDTANSSSSELPTIEDLQRNVSDLEKHAQDLENKLAMRNQREGEHEERLREAEQRLREREQQLQRTQLELQRMEQQQLLAKQTQIAAEQHVAQLQSNSTELENLLQAREQQFNHLQTKLQGYEAQATHIAEAKTDAQSRLQALQSNVEQLQTLLKERDEELKQLRHTLQEQQHLKETVSAIESLIIPEPVIKTESGGSQLQPTLDMFFGSSTAPEFENLVAPQVSDIPVVEEDIVPKKAYLCYPTGDTATPNAAFDLGVDWDDSWNSNEAAAEAAHFSSAGAPSTTQSLVPREQQLELQLQEENERIQELQLALERCEQQKQELQVKSGKMVKKLKEYKVKMDELQTCLNNNTFRKSTSVESNSMFSDLDAAIQEELKTQVKCLEEKLGEQQKVQDTFAVEKDKLLKRIDVLTAGNERMSEMKERQDMDVQMYQARIRELQEKLNRLDNWDEESAVEEPAIAKSTIAPSLASAGAKPAAAEVESQVSLQKIAELRAEIQDITDDRQELQALLEDEKANAARAEETIRTLLEKIAVLDSTAAATETSEKTKYSELQTEYQNLQAMQTSLQRTNEKLTKDWHAMKSEMEEQVQQLSSEKSALQTELRQAQSKIKQLQAQIKKLRAEAQKDDEAYTDFQLQAYDLRERNYELTEANRELETGQMDNVDASDLLLRLQAIATDNEQLRIGKDVLNKKIDDLEIHVSQLRCTPTDESKIAELQVEIKKLKGEMQKDDDTYKDCQLQALELKTRNYELTEANKELTAGAANNTLLQDLQERLQSSVSAGEQLRVERDALSRQLNDLRMEINALKSESPAAAATHNDELSVHLLEKESEIIHLKQRIEDLMREDQTEKLVLEILSKNQEIHLLKMQVKHLEDDKHELEHNLTLQITKEMQAAGKDEAQAQISQLREQVQRLEAQQQQLQTEKFNMEEELKVLNNHVLSSLELEDKMKAAVLELDMKNIEIAELRKSLEALKAKNSSSSSGGDSSTVELDTVALNAQWESIVEQKCSEIAQMWREHLENREREFKQLETRLQDQVLALQAASAAAPPLAPSAAPQQPQIASAETTATSTPASVSTSASVSSSVAASKDGTPLRAHFINESGQEAHEAAADAIIEKMQAALESQEMEIVTLKEQLAIRSAEYARLAAQYDPFKLQTTLSHSGMSTSSGPVSLDSPQSKRSVSSNDAPVVSKSELDLALYMLHQRDMRCEEMTLELMSLLEERDTLQLKLSNTLRQVEAIKAQTGYVDIASTQATTAAGATNAPGTDSPNKSTVAGTTAGDAAADELNQKLSQLQTVKHSRDKLIREEREQSRRQMERIQQDVAKMPSAAMSELVGTDLSQSSQSPSSALLNWLWGNAPPNPAAGGAPPN